MTQKFSWSACFSKGTIGLFLGVERYKGTPPPLTAFIPPKGAAT